MTRTPPGDPLDSTSSPVPITENAPDRRQRRAARKAQKATNRRARRITAWTPRRSSLVVATIIGALALALVLSVTALVRDEGTDDRVTALENAGAAQAAPIPGGFASDCVAMWLEAGADLPNPYLDRCQPGIPLAGGNQLAAQLTADRTEAYSWPSSYANPDDPSEFSVLVSAWIRERVLDENGDPTWPASGIRYYRVSVHVDENGMNLVGHPNEVWLSPDERPTSPGIDASIPDNRDPRTILLASYVEAQATGGNISNYFTPGSPGGRVLPDGQVTDATLVAVGYSQPEDETTTNALAVVELLYPNGATLTTSSSYALVNNEGTWTISEQYRTTPTEPTE